MSLRQLGGLVAAFGGVVWIVRWMFAEEAATVDVTRWAGLAFVLAGLVCVGLTLVNGSAVWLDVVVGLAVPLLAWAVYESIRTASGADLGLHALFGAGALVWGGWMLARGGHPRPDVDGGGRENHQPSHRS